MKKVSENLVRIILVLSFLFAGCSTNQIMLKTPSAVLNQPESGAVLYVDEVSATTGVKISDQRLVEFREMLQSNANGILGPARIESSDNDNQFTLACKVTAFRAGNAFWRFMLIGLGTARFDVDYSLLDTQQNKISNGTVRKYWGWGGIMGGTKDIDDMIKQAANEITSDLKKFVDSN